MFTAAYTVLFAIFLLAQFAPSMKNRLGSSFHISSTLVFFVILIYCFMVPRSNFTLFLVAIALFFQVVSVEMFALKAKLIPWWLEFAFLDLKKIFNRGEIVRHGVMTSVGIYLLAIANTLDHPQLLHPVDGPLVGMMVAFAIYHYFASNVRLGLVEASWMPAMYAVGGTFIGLLVQFGLTEFVILVSQSIVLAILSFVPIAVMVGVMVKYKPGMGGRFVGVLFGTDYCSKKLHADCVLAINFCLIYGWMLCVSWYILQSVVT